MAGLILLVGTAIDANILIFERIREELASGKTIKTAISSGYSKAFSTIFDANLTSLVTAIILYWFGTGPIKGFAVTLIVGLIASMFTSVFVSRYLYDVSIYFRSKGGKEPINTISIGSTKSFRGLKVPWLKYQYYFIGLSLILIVVGMYSVGTKGFNWGIDFRGGQEVEVKFASQIEPRALESLP